MPKKKFINPYTIARLKREKEKRRLEAKARRLYNAKLPKLNITKPETPFTKLVKK